MTLISRIFSILSFICLHAFILTILHFIQYKSKIFRYSTDASVEEIKNKFVLLKYNMRKPIVHGLFGHRFVEQFYEIQKDTFLSYHKNPRIGDIVKIYYNPHSGQVFLNDTTQSKESKLYNLKFIDFFYIFTISFIILLVLFLFFKVET